MFCTSCAAFNSLDRERCHVCGAAIRETRTVAESARVSARSFHGLLRFVPFVALVAGMLIVAAVMVDRRANEADAYRTGLAAVASGDFAGAAHAFGQADGYRDARARQTAALIAVRALDRSYEAGLTAFADGEFDIAIALLLPVVRDYPGFRDAGEVLGRARAARVAELREQASAAIANGNWTTAETALSTLLAVNPSDSAAARELATVQHDHAAIVFVDHQTLYAIGPGDTGPRAIVSSISAAWPVWNPDRTKIAFVSPTDPADQSSERALYVVNADGSGLTMLTNGPAPWTVPVWSPDGTAIAFEYEGHSTDLELDVSTIAIVDVTSGALTQIGGGTIPNATSPTWSPTGDRLAFVVRTLDPITAQKLPDGWTGAGLLGDVYVLTIATGAIHNLSHGSLPYPWRIAWSPSTDLLLAFCRADGTSFRQGTIYLLDAVDGASRPVDLTTLDVALPVWSPGGTRFAYVVYGGNIRVYDLDRTWVSLHATIPISRFLAWSPSGDALLVAAASMADPSPIFDLNAPYATPRTVPLDFDGDTPWAGPPAWAAANPARTAALPSFGGTGLDRSAT